MKTVDVYIGTDLHGSGKGLGKAIYIMRTQKGNGAFHESRPAVRAAEDATESQLVLLALRDALMRLVYACEVVVHTECFYVAAAVNNMWPQEWQRSGWQNAKGRQIKDLFLWEGILFELEDGGHILKAVCGKHEFSLWMKHELPHLAAGVGGFEAVEQKVIVPVGDRY